MPMILSLSPGGRAFSISRQASRNTFRCSSSGTTAVDFVSKQPKPKRFASRTESKKPPPLPKDHAIDWKRTVKYLGKFDRRLTSKSQIENALLKTFRVSSNSNRGSVRCPLVRYKCVHSYSNRSYLVKNLHLKNRLVGWDQTQTNRPIQVSQLPAGITWITKFSSQIQQKLPSLPTSNQTLFDIIRNVFSEYTKPLCSVAWIQLYPAPRSTDGCFLTVFDHIYITVEPLESALA